MSLLLSTAIICFISTFCGNFIRRMKVAALFCKKFDTVPEDLKAQLQKAHDELKNIKTTESGQSIHSEYGRTIRQMRAQRQVDVILEQIQQKRNVQRSQAEHVEVFITYALKMLLFITLAVITIMNLYNPVIIFHKGITLYPFENLLNFPTGLHNAISLPAWILCCSLTFQVFTRLIK